MSAALQASDATAPTYAISPMLDRGTVGAAEHFTWDELRDKVENPPTAATKAEQTMLVPGVYRHGRRTCNTLVGRNLVTLDFDNVTDVEAFVTAFAATGVRALVHTTFSHPNADGSGRLRVYVPLTRAVDDREWRERIKPWMATVAGAALDTNAISSVHFSFAPSKNASAPDAYRWWEIDGLPLDVDALPITASTPVALSAGAGFAIGPDHPEWAWRHNAAARWLRDVPPCISGQGGQAEIWTVACELVRGFEFSVDDSVDVLEDYNARCLPPWSEEELRHHLTNASRNADIFTGWRSRGFTEFCSVAVANDGGPQTPGPSGGAALDYARLRDLANKEPPKTSFARGDHAELAEELLRTCGHRTVTSEGSIWAYDPARGVWSADQTEKRLKTLLLDKAGFPCGTKGAPLRVNSNTLSGVADIIRLTTEEDAFFKGAPFGLACANGFVTLDGTSPHSPENRARHFYPDAFDPDAQSLPWLAFLESLFRDDADKAEKIACLQEYFGAALFGMSIPAQKSLFEEGEGSNGKSALNSIMGQVFPEGSTHAIPPSKWGHTFTMAHLVGVRLNVVGELPANTALDSETFKKVTGGDTISGEIKGGASFEFRPIAGHVFAANRLPPSEDQSRGFWRRMLVVSFNRNFETDPDRDHKIVDKLLASERAGILAWLVAGAKRLRAQGHRYTTPTSHGGALSRWQGESDTVRLYADEHLTPNAKGTPARDLYMNYALWAKEGGFKAVSETLFGRRMKAAGHESQKTNVVRYFLTSSYGATRPG